MTTDYCTEFGLKVIVPKKAKFTNHAFTYGSDFHPHFKNHPLGQSVPWYPTVNIPELEAENRITLLQQEYRSYLLSSMLNIFFIAGIPIPPINTVATIPITWLDYHNSGTYPKRLKEKVNETFDIVYSAIPTCFKFYGGEFDFDCPDFKIQNAWSYILTKNNNIMFEALNNAVPIAMNMIQAMYPSIPRPFWMPVEFPNVESLVSHIISSSLSKAAKVEELKIVKVHTKVYDEIIGGVIEEKISIDERKIERIVETLHNYAVDYSHGELWINSVLPIMGYLSLLSPLATITPFMSKTFCMYLDEVVSFEF